MAWWDRVVSPMRRVWNGVAARLGVRKSGLRRLRQEVSTCEYEDVHVMWGLLMDMNASSSRRIGGPSCGDYSPATSVAAAAAAADASRRRRRGARSRSGAHVWDVLEWARGKASSFHLCRSF